MLNDMVNFLQFFKINGVGFKESKDGNKTVLDIQIGVEKTKMCIWDNLENDEKIFAIQNMATLLISGKVVPRDYSKRNKPVVTPQLEILKGRARFE